MSDDMAGQYSNGYVVERSSLSVGILLLTLLLFSEFRAGNCQLKTTFYSKTCPTAESIVQNAVSIAISNDQNVAGNILRLLFHDCFCGGCDASILLDSVNGQPAEKDAPPNQSLRGFDVIDSAKASVEAVCPGVVSCADTLAFAARDSVVQMGGQWWPVQAGRRDGSTSSASDATASLPSFSASVAQLTQAFQARGLTASEMVILSGAHTIGGAACSSFGYRLYGFNGTHPQDPTLNLTLAGSLKATCPSTSAGGSGSSSRVDLDVSTPHRFDNLFYQNLAFGEGVLQSDQLLSTDPLTKGHVRQLAGNNTMFLSKFAKAMVKMSAIGVKTGTQGQVRLHCSQISS